VAVNQPPANKMSAQPTSYRPAVQPYATNMNMNMKMQIKNKVTNIQIGSLNCRSLSKPSNPTTSQAFSRFLSSSKFEILCLQETHAHDETTQERLNIQLNAQQSIWTSHCGIVSLNPHINLESISVSRDGRIILCRVSHPNNSFPSFPVMNVYAPAKDRQRYAFYAQLLQSVSFHNLFTNMTTDNPLATQHPSIVVGDFNYDFTQFPAHSFSNISPADLAYIHSVSPPQASPTETLDQVADSDNPQSSPTHTALSRCQWLWHSMILHHYTERSHQLQTNPTIPTFRRLSAFSTIDYMFVSPDLSPFVTQPDIQFLSENWTDHALLQFSLRFTSNDHGTGFWKAPPSLARNEYFITQLYAALDEFHSNLTQAIEPPPIQSSWDTIKQLTQTLARKIGRNKADWRTRHLKQFQRKRNKLIKSFKGQKTLATQILKVEKQITNLQEELVEVAAMKAGLRWREKGEKSAGLMKRLATRREHKRSIETLHHPDTDTLCSSPSDLQSAARRYYEVLYTPTPVDPTHIEYFTNQIPPSDRLSPSTQENLCVPFQADDLLDGASRAPTKSSPGMDGLPYDILVILFKHPSTLQLALQVYNAALSNGIFPQSWQETCLILLPKKGDLSQLKNWRPISLINTDAKIFTRLINLRLMTHLGTRISTMQMGFMPTRFIGEQGMIVQCLQEIATKSGSSSIALLLDQEKAYDRVHLDYLRACMEAFHIPTTLTTTIINLFSSTTSTVNVNGFLSPTFQQRRGLRQGDPLSPLLFNIAFDPLLRAINNNSSLEGFNISRETNQPMSPSSPSPIKVLAYADDTIVFLRNPSEFGHLQTLITNYMLASNSSLNYTKTQALSLSGQPHPHWRSFLQEQGITAWHDSQASQPLIYLGYAICSSANQRASYATSIISMLRSYCLMHSQRSLTYRGRVTVINSLLFSKLWHVMRIFTFSPPEIKQMQQIAATFINNGAIITRFSFDHLILPIDHGGLNLLDPAKQASALQWRWIYHLISPQQTSLRLMPSIPVLRATLDYILATPRYPTYHWSLLFPQCRPTIPRLFGSVRNILRSVDTLPHQFNLCPATMSTCLHLPIKELLVHTLPDNHPIDTVFQPPTTVIPRHSTIWKLYGSDIFTFNHLTLHLEFHQNTRSLPHHTSSKKAIALIQSNQLLLNNFVLYNFLPNVPRPQNALDMLNIPDTNIPSFSALRPFATALMIPKLFHQPSTKLHPTSMRYYKFLLTSYSPPPSSSTLHQSQWKRFWKLEIALNARNTWYRILHHKITTKQYLHSRMPQKFSPHCTICPSSASQIETREHFLFACPSKFAVWSTALSTYIDPSLHSPTFAQYLDFVYMRSTSTVSSDALYPTLSTSQVFSCILQAIWNSHYRFTFDKTPFDSTQVLHAVARALYTLYTHDNIHHLM
jgi:exonuclease III